MAAIAHASPMPKNTLTALEPVTLPMEESAVLSWMAAVYEKMGNNHVIASGINQIFQRFWILYDISTAQTFEANVSEK